MKAILLAAGLGTRLAPLTDVLPKCLMPIHGRPLLEYWFIALRKAGVTEFLVNTHYKPELVRRYLKASPLAAGAHVTYESELLGTAGTLLANRDFAGDEPVILAHADNLCGADFSEFISAHASRGPGALMTMMSFKTDSPRSCGILELDANGMVVGFHEKVANPPGDNANAAVYIVEPEVAAFAASYGREVVDFSTEIIPHFIGRIQAWPNHGYHRDIGSLASLMAAQEEYVHAGDKPALSPDPWRELCAENSWELTGRLSAALAQGLAPKTALRAANLVELDRFIPAGQGAPHDAPAVFLDDAGGDAEKVCRALASRGWRCLAMCA